MRWLAHNQGPDGRWEANGGQYPSTCTALAGLAMLMEGSTTKEGKYSENLRKCVKWFTTKSRVKNNGLLGDPDNPTESSRYLYGHGFALLFLASVYGEEDNEKDRKELERVLTKAVEFTGRAQTTRNMQVEGKQTIVGGWGYVSAEDGGNFDEGSVTVTQLQALRAARNAGIYVPKSIIDKATAYLKVCTTPRGGIIYSLATGAAVAGQERPPLTAAAVACAFSAGDYNSEYAKKWLKYCKENIPFGHGRLAHDEYQNYYFSQCMYILGDDGYAKMFPGEKDPMKWSDFRKTMYDEVIKRNMTKDEAKKEGYWGQGGVGTVFTTAINLTILQLENGTLPIYQR